MIELPREETERRWQMTTPQWPIMHAVTYGVSRDQMMARHKSNHIQVAYGPDAAGADLALATKTAMFRELGIEVFICGNGQRPRRITGAFASGADILAFRLIFGGTVRVGIIGTGAISWKHAGGLQKYRVRNNGMHRYSRTKRTQVRGREWWRVRTNVRRVCPAIRKSITLMSARSPISDLQPIQICAETKKHVQVQKPIATNLQTARGHDHTWRARPVSCWALSASIDSTIRASS